MTERGNRAVDQATGLASAGLAGPEGSQSGDPEVLPRRFGRYMLMRKLASGGMAEIYLALHRSVAFFEKLVVIKRILPQMNRDQQFIDMLLHEARIAASLSHPNVVQTFDVGEVDGSYFIAMEHVHGEDIRTIVRQMRNKRELEFPLEHALAIVIGLASGLAYAHEKRDLEGNLLGIVHRDISPQNIVVTYSGDVKVVDFGVAKSQHITDESKGGQLKGKVPYMSPEQAGGLDIDCRSDLFSVGVVLFELTTGKRLFKGATESDTLKLICESEYPMPGDVVPNYPPELERIVMRALAKRRQARYQSAREMQADLEAYVRHERLPVSTVTMSAWMQRLFAERLSEQKTDLQAIKLLADEIAAMGPPSDEPPPPRTLPPATNFDPFSTITAAPAAVNAAPSPQRGAGRFVGILLALIAGASVSYFALKGGNQHVGTPAVDATEYAVEPAAPADAKGTLEIASEPEGAAIWIDGDLQQKATPAMISLPVGPEIQIKLTKEGFESFREVVKLTEALEVRTIQAKLNRITLDIQPEPLAPTSTGDGRALPSAQR